MADEDHVPAGRIRRLGRLAYLTARTTGDLLAAQARRRLTGDSLPRDDLRKAGATIIDGAKEVYERSDMIVKVKEPLPEEYPFLREGQILYT